MLVSKGWHRVSVVIVLAGMCTAADLLAGSFYLVLSELMFVVLPVLVFACSSLYSMLG